MHATMQCAATGHQVTVPALIGTLRLQEQELLVKKEKVNVDRQGLKCELSKFKSDKDGPCSSCYEPVLQMHRICRQPYHGGAFIGNHVKRALEPDVSQAISTAVIVAVEHVCPNSQDMKDASHIIADRYSTLFMQFAACRRQYSSCSGVTAQQITRFASDIATFMASVRKEIVGRGRGAITPKLHLLEDHVVPQMTHFSAGLGLFGEQGGELTTVCTVISQMLSTDFTLPQSSTFCLLCPSYRAVFLSLVRGKMIIHANATTESFTYAVLLFLHFSSPSS